MEILADEGVDREIVVRLRADGHRVEYIAELAPGLGDASILEKARARSAILVTADKDFGELVFRQRRASAGVVLVRLAGLSDDGKASLVSGAFSFYGEAFREAFAVISPGVVRIRPRRAESD